MTLIKHIKKVEIRDTKMNDFCRNLMHSLIDKFEIDVDVYVSEKKKKLVHISSVKPLISYVFFGDIVQFIRSYW